jgi:hypothetical protein
VWLMFSHVLWLHGKAHWCRTIESWGALALGWSGYIIYKAIFPSYIKHSLPPNTYTHFDRVTRRVCCLRSGNKLTRSGAKHAKLVHQGPKPPLPTVQADQRYQHLHQPYLSIPSIPRSSIVAI